MIRHMIRMCDLMIVLRFLLDLTRRLSRHGCASLAASLAFFSLLSLFPLVFLLLYGVSFVVSQDVIGEQVLLSFLKGFLPSLGERLAEELHRVSALETVRWAVFLSFAWFGGLVFYELDYALNVVFESTWRRHPAHLNRHRRRLARGDRTPADPLVCRRPKLSIF